MHQFYSFRGRKNQMRIRIECGLDSRSRAGFWKNDRAGVLTFFRLRWQKLGADYIREYTVFNNSVSNSGYYRVTNDWLTRITRIKVK
jgi:hypothetical protein